MQKVMLLVNEVYAPKTKTATITFDTNIFKHAILKTENTQ